MEVAFSTINAKIDSHQLHSISPTISRERNKRGHILEMRPTTSTTAASPTAAATVGFHRWNSPVPYLFGGLALMLGLITLALVILACSYKNSSSSDSSSTGAEEKPGRPSHVLQPEMEPKIVVIMAGDENPTFLAKPVSSTRHSEQV